MEDQNLLDYDYTMLESPPNLVINLDTPVASNDASSVTKESSSAGASLPSFNIFSQAQSVSDNDCWYKLPTGSKTSTPITTETVEPCSENQSSVSESASSEKQEICDRSFDIDNLLAIERHYYSPRHSTPSKDVHYTFTHQMPETRNIFQTNVNVNNVQHSTFAINSLLKATSQDHISEVHSVCRRQEDKPPYTYVSMIIVAILNSEEKGLTLAGIREKLMEMFPFFRGEYTGWKNSIRHALSNSKCFYKVQKKDDQDISTVYVWKVNMKGVKSYTFNRQSKGPRYENYKLTIQEELGLPPFEYSSDDDSFGNDIELPPKPCFHSDSVSSVSGDLTNTRNDSVPTPLSVISDVDSVHSSNTDMKPSLKRKANEYNSLMQQTFPASKRQMTSYNYPDYGYQQYSDGVNHPSYFRSAYHNSYSSPMTNSDQLSHDISQYGYQQQYNAQAMNLNAYSNEILAMRNLWWSYYNEMVPSNSHTQQNTTSSDWYPSEAINMTTCDKQTK